MEEKLLVIHLNCVLQFVENLVVRVISDFNVDLLRVDDFLLVFFEELVSGVNVQGEFDFVEVVVLQVVVVRLELRTFPGV